MYIQDSPKYRSKVYKKPANVPILITYHLFHQLTIISLPLPTSLDTRHRFAGSAPSPITFFFRATSQQAIHHRLIKSCLSPDRSDRPLTGCFSTRHPPQIACKGRKVRTVSPTPPPSLHSRGASCHSTGSLSILATTTTASQSVSSRHMRLDSVSHLPADFFNTPWFSKKTREGPS